MFLVRRLFPFPNQFRYCHQFPCHLRSVSSLVVPVSSIDPVSPTGLDSPTINTLPVQDVSWDLSSTSTYRDPWEIDSRVPTNIWKVIPLEPVANYRYSVPPSTATRYDHLAHDPRLFFAGAPSSYMEHPLASTIQSTINLCR